MKKLISVLLSSAILLSASTFCMADENDAWKENVGKIKLNDMTVTGKGISVTDNVIYISAGGDFEVSGVLKDGMIRVNTEEKVKLRLSGASITNSSGPAIYFENAEKCFITITEGTENYLADAAEYDVDDADAALFSNDDLEIKGAGVLVVDGNYKHGIASDDDLIIKNGDITITSYEHGIKVNDTLEISGGSINIDAETGKGMKAKKELIIEDGAIDIVTTDEGIESKGILTINGGNINIKAGDDGINTGNISTTTDTTTETVPDDRRQPEMNFENPPEKPDGAPEFPEGMQGGMPGGGRGEHQAARGEQPWEREQGEPPMKPDGESMPNMKPEDNRDRTPGGMGGGAFGRVDEETAAEHAITITGGNIYINAGGDGIDSNGSLTISGGTLIIDGPESNGDGPLDSDGAMSITGGEIITLSSAGMVQLPNSEGNQNVLRVNFSENGSAGDIVEVRDADGKVLMTHEAAKTYRCLIYSSDKIDDEESYFIYVNDELQQEVTVGNGAGGFGGGMNGTPGGGRGDKNHESFGGNRDRINVTMNGSPIRFDTDPIIKNDTTLVGFRAILEALGAKVDWDEEKRRVTAIKDGVVIELTIGSDKAYVGGEEKTLAAAPEIVGDSTLVPIRFVSEELGMNVNWDANIKHIAITNK